MKSKFGAYFVPTENVVYESAQFTRRNQEAGETIDEFLTALHCLASRCDYGDLKERLIRVRFVVGLRDSMLSESLQMDAAFTPEIAAAKARLKESVGKQQEDLKLEMVLTTGGPRP